MVDSIKSIAARSGAVCYADPFLPTTNDTVEEGVLSRATGWLARRQADQLALDRPGNPQEQLTKAFEMLEAGGRGQYRTQSV